MRRDWENRKTYTELVAEGLKDQFPKLAKRLTKRDTTVLDELERLPFDNVCRMRLITIRQEWTSPQSQ